MTLILSAQSVTTEAEGLCTLIEEFKVKSSVPVDLFVVSPPFITLSLLKPRTSDKEAGLSLDLLTATISGFLLEDLSMK